MLPEKPTLFSACVLGGPHSSSSSVLGSTNNREKREEAEAVIECPAATGTRTPLTKKVFEMLEGRLALIL
ncbi:unnamed protein product, partial [Brassica napus]